MSWSVRLFLKPFFYGALNVVESLKFMHIYLNQVKINCFLDVYKHNFIKIQSSNATSCQYFWTGFFNHVFCAL